MSDVQKKFKYTLLYQLKPIPDGMTKEQIEEMNAKLPEDERWSACNAATFMSLIFPPDGSYSWFLIPVDGRPEAKDKGHELSDEEVFKAWAMLAHRLAESQTLGEGKKMLCAQVHEIMVDAIRRGREDKTS